MPSAPIRSADAQHELGAASPGGLASAVAVSRGASYLTIQTLITSIAQALSFAILARIITPSEVGILAVLSLIIALAQALNGAAFQQASTKFIGELTSDTRESASAVFYQSIRVTLLLSIPISIIIFVGAPVLATALLASPARSGLFRVLAIDILVYSGVLSVTMGTIFGLNRFKAAAIIGSAGTILRQVLIIVLIVAMRNFVGLVVAWVVSDVVMLAAYGLVIIRVLGFPTDLFPFRRLLSFSWPLSIGNVISFAYGWFDRAILIAFVPLASLGVYNAALTAFGVVTNMTGSVNNAVLPAYSNISGRSGLESCRRATWLSSRYASLTMVPLAFGLFATARLALTIFVGQAYVGGTESLMILSSIFAFTLFGLTLGTMLLALSQTRAVLSVTIASVLLGLASAYVLLPFIGITGASIARGVAMLASLSLNIVVLKRKDALRIDAKTMWKSLVAGGVMAGVLVIAQMIIYSKILMPAYIVLGGIVYLLALRVLKAVQEHDIDLIRRYLGSRLDFVSKVLDMILIAK